MSWYSLELTLWARMNNTCRVNHSSKALCKRMETAFVLMCNIILFEIYFKKRTEHLIKVNKNTRKFKCGMFLINALGKYKGKAPLTFSFWSVYFFLSVSNCPDDHLQCSWVILSYVLAWLLGVSLPGCLLFSGCAVDATSHKVKHWTPFNYSWLTRFCALPLGIPSSICQCCLSNGALC